MRDIKLFLGKTLLTSQQSHEISGKLLVNL